MVKVILIIGILVLLISCVCVYAQDTQKPMNLSKANAIDKNNEDYYGPVPIGYDLEHFRKTGETVKEVCLRTEWNNNFGKYRAGQISKDSMIKYIRECK